MLLASHLGDEEAQVDGDGALGFVHGFQKDTAVHARLSLAPLADGETVAGEAARALDGLLLLHAPDKEEDDVAAGEGQGGVEGEGGGGGGRRRGAARGGGGAAPRATPGPRGGGRREWRARGAPWSGGGSGPAPSSQPAPAPRTTPPASPA